MDESVAGFYDELAADYELVYPRGWADAVSRHGAALDALIRERLPGATTVLDCSCGIGTQAIGLARLGYRVTGTDVSSGALARARREAGDLAITFARADFRDLGGIEGTFDVVISCDNALPHLLEPADVVRALAEMHAKLCPGGLLVVTMRDFDRALIDKPSVAQPIVAGGRVLVRLHEWEDDEYTVRYLLLTEHGDGWTVEERRTRYRAITRRELEEAATDFHDLRWEGHAIVGDQQVFTARA